MLPVRRQGQQVGFAPAPLPPLQEALSDAAEAARQLEAAEIASSPASPAASSSEARTPSSAAAGDAAPPQALNTESGTATNAEENPDATSALEVASEAAALQAPLPSPPSGSADALDRLSNALRF